MSIAPFKTAVSGAFLLAANILPLTGVLFLGWQVSDVFALFWLENVIIGVLNVVKMVTAAVLLREISFALIAPFFVLHYGMFTMVHGVFVFAIFGAQALGGEIVPAGQDAGMGNPFDLLAASVAQSGGYIAAVGLFLSHFMSYLLNFIGRGEYQKIDAQKLMMAPYGRIIMLHLTIIIGGGLVLATGQAVWALGLLCVIKTVLDLAMHMKEHGVWKPSGLWTRFFRSIDKSE